MGRGFESLLRRQKGQGFPGFSESLHLLSRKYFEGALYFETNSRIGLYHLCWEGLTLGTLRRNMREFDFLLVGILVIMAVYAYISISAAVHNNPNPNIPSHILLKQIVWEAVGVVVMFMAAAFDYRLLRPLRWWIYGASMGLLTIVFAFPAQQGAHSWINLKVISLQPSELAKLALIISLAAFMANFQENETVPYKTYKMWPMGIMFLIPFLLTYKEPALGQALVMAAIMLTMYTAFSKRSHFLVLLLAVVAVVSLSTMAATMYSTQTTTFINNVLVKHHILKSYQVNRIIVWLNPNYSLNNYGYNNHLAQVAIGSGGLFGQGLYKGTLTNNGWVPNQWDDYIFTAVGEEFGYVGSASLVLLFLMLMYRLAKISRTTEDPFGQYLAIGALGMFAFQVFENIGMDMYLSPATGITLPFISYGGTSLVVDYLTIGLVLSVGLHKRSLKFSFAKEEKRFSQHMA